jgi:sugar phosphate permease
MSTTTSVGIFLSYGLSALLVMFNVYQIIFLIATVVMSVSAVFWVLLYNKMTLRETPSEEEHFEVKVKQQKQKTDRSVYKILVIFGLFAVVVNLIKDGLSTWIPNVLKEIYGLQDSLSIFLTLFVPVLGIFASAMVVAMNKKIKDHNALMAILFAMATELSLVVVLMLKTSAWVVVLIAFAALVFLMSASNNVITSILPFWLRDKANSGFVAGILNGCCYVGSTISSVGLGSIAENFGWSIVFDIFLILTAVVVLYACIILIVKKIREKRNKTIQDKTK